MVRGIKIRVRFTKATNNKLFRLKDKLIIFFKIPNSIFEKNIDKFFFLFSIL
jgi:hypothetical protein